MKNLALPLVALMALSACASSRPVDSSVDSTQESSQTEARTNEHSTGRKILLFFATVLSGAGKGMQNGRNSETPPPRSVNCTTLYDNGLASTTCL